MILEYKFTETDVQAAWLKTLYDMIDELNCRSQTYVEETYNRAFRHFTNVRTIQIYGSNTMLSWLKLRMERYSHFIDSFNQKPEIKEVLNEDY